MNTLRALFKIEINTNRVYGLDLLRAMAILFVMLGHSFHLLPHGFQKTLRVLVFDGVSIFFVLSGFLIGGILIKTFESNEPSISGLKNFWKRRWFRTLPNYFLILLLITSYYALTNTDFKLSEISLYFIFSQNINSAHPAFFHEAWSLSVEEWFYVFTPILVFTIARTISKHHRKKTMLIVIFIMLLLPIFIRLYKYLSIDVISARDWDLLFRKQVLTRLDSPAFGILGAYFHHYYPKKWNSHTIPLLVSGITILILIQLLAYFGITSTTGFFSCIISFSAISIASLLMLPYLSNLKQTKGFIYKLTTTISLISYSMYLINLTLIQNIIFGLIPWASITEINSLQLTLKYFSFWAFTIMGSIIIYKYYEIPLTSLRERDWSFSRKNAKREI